METRSIPFIQNTEGLENLQIVQVVTAIRHGSRTPWQSHKCWDGYFENPSQSKWDCDLTTLTAPPQQHAGEDTPFFLFEKVYDSLKEPITNELRGTCQKGQLLMAGYYQEQQNGQYLRQTYLSEQSINLDAGVSMRLFNSTHFDERPYMNATYFRADDGQRVLMSGQVLLGAMFDVSNDTIMQLHTADKYFDIVDPNEKNCPRLQVMKSKAKSSEGYSNINETDVAIDMNDTLMKMNSSIEVVLDCMMTTICNDRPMPSSLDNFQYNGDDSTFTQMEDYWTELETFHFDYNDGEFSKIAMSPLWSDVAGVIHAAKVAKTPEKMKESNVPKFFLISGHDTTLLPMLVSLGVWDKVWVPYASMLIIEVYTTDTNNQKFPSGFVFRLLYNGRAITEKMNKCDGEICDLDVLLDQISFAQWDQECSAEEEQSDVTRDSENESDRDGSSGVSVETTAISILVSSTLSSLATVIFMTWKNGKRKSTPTDPSPQNLTSEHEII